MPTLYRYSVRTIHGAAKLESELDGLSSEGWEPISFQHDAAGNFEVVLRRDGNGSPNGEIKQVQPAAPAAESRRYAVRTIRTPKLESDLSTLSSDGWDAISFQHDPAGGYEVVLRKEPDPAGRNAHFRYALRSIHGAAKLESQLAELSAEGWEPVRLHRDGAGSYEVILRQSISPQLAQQG